MTNKKNRKKIIMQYKHSPKIEGATYVTFAVLLNAVSIIASVIVGKTSLAMMGFVLGLVVIAFGLYYIFLVKKPLIRTVAVGTWINRLYLRNKPLFVLVQIIIWTASMAAVSLLFSLIGYIFSDQPFDIIREMSETFFRTAALATLFITINVFKYYGYYHSPEESRKQI